MILNNDLKKYKDDLSLTVRKMLDPNGYDEECFLSFMIETAEEADMTLIDTMHAAVLYFYNHGAIDFIENPRSFEFRWPTDAEDKVLRGRSEDYLTHAELAAVRKASLQVVKPAGQTQ